MIDDVRTARHLLPALVGPPLRRVNKKNAPVVLSVGWQNEAKLPSYFKERSDGQEALRGRVHETSAGELDQLERAPSSSGKVIAPGVIRVCVP
jgi:hypothetical protein